MQTIKTAVRTRNRLVRVGFRRALAQMGPTALMRVREWVPRISHSIVVQIQQRLGNGVFNSLCRLQAHRSRKSADCCGRTAQARSSRP
jgi:hypothetical protein